MADDEGAFEGGKERENAFAFEIERRVLGRTVRGVRFLSGDQPDPDGPTGTSFTLYFDDGAAVALFVEGPAKVSILVGTGEKRTEGGGMVQ